MDFLVEMEICYPPDYDPELLADLSRRERERAAEIRATSNFFKEMWIVPGRRARILVCSAADAAELHATLDTLPAIKWLKLQVTPLVQCEDGAAICIPE